MESREPKLMWASTECDAWVSTLNPASQQFLENINIWPQLRSTAMGSLQKMQVWDGVGGGEIEFDAAQLGVHQLAAVVENREIIRALWQYCQQSALIELHAPMQANALVQSDDVMQLNLSDGTALQAELIVGADGPQSWLRQQMQVQVSEQPYHQAAVIAVIQHEHSHQQTAHQVFLPTGPLALLPMADPQYSTLVWSTSPTQAAQLDQAAAIEFNRRLQNNFGERLGDLNIVGDTKSIPLTQRRLAQYVEPHLALIGDAAHTLHPLAGQGANLGLMDAACLAQCLIDAQQQHRSLGALRTLRRYERWRKGDINSMMLAMRVFKELFASESILLVQARSIGLKVNNRCEFLKHFWMKVALGKSKDLPHLASSCTN